MISIHQLPREIYDMLSEPSVAGVKWVGLMIGDPRLHTLVILSSVWKSPSELKVGNPFTHIDSSNSSTLGRGRCLPW